MPEPVRPVPLDSSRPLGRQTTEASGQQDVALKQATTSVKSARGQTEPLAALVSIAAICVAISVYTGFATALLAGFESERAADRATLDSVWADLNQNGLVEGNGTAIERRVGPKTLPRGHRVELGVTIVGDDGRRETVDGATFDTDGRRRVLEPPDSAPTSTRPVPVRVAPGDVRPGRLTVVVWDE